jgi:hypothetical protein
MRDLGFAAEILWLVVAVVTATGIKGPWAVHPEG